MDNRTKVTALSKLINSIDKFCFSKKKLTNFKLNGLKLQLIKVIGFKVYFCLKFS